MEFSHEIKNVNLSDLKPHPKNPRVHPDKLITKLVKSINEFGFTNPVLIDADNRILAGHARCKAAEKMGLTEVPAVMLPLYGAAADAYVIADNKLNELSVWDENVLADLVAEIDAAGFDVDFTGFDTDEIDALLSPKGVIEDNFDEEKVVKEVVEHGAATRCGDIWLLGNHRLICGDTTLPETFAVLMEDKKAQMCVTSPPYGLGGTKTYETGNLDDWFSTMKPAIKNMCRHADVVAYNIGDKFTTGSAFCEPTFAYSIQMFADNGFRMLYTRIWDKKRQALSSSSPYHLASLKPLGDAEYVAAFAGDEFEENEEVDISEHSFISAFANNNYKFVKRLSKQERREWGWSSMWRIVSVVGSAHTKGRLDERNHKARFPLELPWRLIKMHSDAGNIVLEPFSGTFTSGIACEQLGRLCYAIERDPTYCDISVARFHKFAPDAEIVLFRDGKLIPLEDTGVLL